MATRPFSRIINQKMLPRTPVSCSNHSKRCLRDFPLKHSSSYSTREFSSARTVVPGNNSPDNHVSGSHVSVNNASGSQVKSRHSNKSGNVDSRWYNEQRQLFQDPNFFETPVLMLHCQWTDFAVSLHDPHKLDELDCTWSCFPSDIKIYGSSQRIEKKTVHLIMARAKVAMKKYEGRKWRIVFKGYNSKTLQCALEYFDGSDVFEFVSLTDLSRKFGEESMVYQRPVPRYPIYKKPYDGYMADGPEWVPTTLLDKFRKLNVTMLERNYEKGVGLTIKSEEGKASKRGFILKKSDHVDKRKHVEEGVKSLNNIKHLIKR